MANDIEKNNANVTEDGVKIGEEYDAARTKAAEDRANDEGESLGDSRAKLGGAVVSGTGASSGLVTQFPGAVDRFGTDDVSAGGQAARAAKGLDTGDVVTEDTTWTAQSALPYVASNAQDVPGQTFRVDELPDPEVVNASSLPAHAIPEGLVVEGTRTDDINTSQERGGDVGTAPQTPNNPSLEAPRTSGGRAAGRASAKADKQ